MTVMMLLIISTMLSAETSNTQFIFKNADGNYYMSEESVITLANYLKQLESLLTNYGEQIDNLKKEVENLTSQNQLLQVENEQLKKQLEEQKAQKITWTVVAALTIGGVLYLFVK